MSKAPRNYSQEYKNFQGRPEQKKARALRNAARAKEMKAGKVHKGDGMDVNHRAGVAGGNSSSNLSIETASANRSYPRGSKGQDLEIKHGIPRKKK